VAVADSSFPALQRLHGVFAFLLVFALSGSAQSADSSLGSCGGPSTKIHEIQGRGRSSPLVGAAGVVVEAVVVGLFPGLPEGLGGLFLQEEDVDVDLDPETSEGLFVYAPDLEVALWAGDVVRLRGEVQEFFGMTELVRVDALVRCPVSATATSAYLELPVPVVAAAAPEYLERFEGMHVRSSTPLFVIGQYATGRFGEVELAGVERLWQSTQAAVPGPEAVARHAHDQRLRILLDDGRARVAPDPWPYLEPAEGGTLRLGDRVSPLAGVLGFSYGRFRVQPTVPPRFHARSVSPPPPLVPGSLRVVAWNVQNLFNGDGTGGGFPTRGAASSFEYERQLAKVVATLSALDADVLALVELENDGLGAGSVLSDLVSALAAHDPALDYRPVDPMDSLGTQAIAVGLLYRAESIAPLGAAAVLDSGAHVAFDSSRNRPSLAQSFRHPASGEEVTVVVSHFKSKGSSCSAAGDPDLGDGQGECNGTRSEAARALAEWVTSQPTESDAPVLLVGDLNAYPREDPLALLAAAGFVDLVAMFDSDDAYTYVFDGRVGRLDHALASPELVENVGGAAVWNVNTDESLALGYREDNPATLYQADPRRASDHDPLIVGLFPLPIPEPRGSEQTVTALLLLCLWRRRRCGSR
jgi:predicted extracellular nuclease